MKRSERKARSARFAKFVEWSDDAKVYAELCGVAEEWVSAMSSLRVTASMSWRRTAGAKVLRAELSPGHRIRVSNPVYEGVKVPG